MMKLTTLLWLLFAAMPPAAAQSLDAALVSAVALGESEAKLQAIGALAASGQPAALRFLEALQDGTIQVAGERVLAVKDDQGIDVVTQDKVVPLPEPREDVILNNRVRRELFRRISLSGGDLRTAQTGRRSSRRLS